MPPIDIRKPISREIKEDLRLDGEADLLRVELAAKLEARQEAIDKMSGTIKEIKEKLKKIAADRETYGDETLPEVVNNLLKWQEEIDYLTNMKEVNYYEFVRGVCRKVEEPRP